jgi:small subunit ribosomal protein S6
LRRYELMLVLRPDIADDAVQAIIDRATRSIVGSEGQIVKVSPWGRRRLAYPIGQYREGSYFIIVFDAPSEAIVELERGLNITEEVMRHLVTRVERPASARRPAATGEEETADEEPENGPPAEDEDEDTDSEFIDESESEAAPAATDR